MPNLAKTTTFLPKLNSPAEIKAFLEESTLTLAQFWTGILGSETSDWRLSTGKMVQAVVTGKLLTQVGREIKHYVEIGKIKEDYFATNKNQATLLELLKFIDADIPDEELFNAAKSIFYSTVAIDSDAAKEELGYQLLQICKQLSSLDILILKACFQISITRGSGVDSISDFGGWCSFIAEKIGYELPELVGARDIHLVDMGLLSGRTYSDRSGISAGPNARLTRLGIKFCEFITEWGDKV